MNNFLASETAIGTFVNSSPSPVLFWSYTDSIEWRELVPRQRTGDCSEIRPSLRIVLCCCHVTILFSAQNRSLLFFAEVSVNTMLPFFVSPLLKRHLPNLCSLFQRNLRAHVSPGPRDWAVTGCNQSGISCVGSSLHISSEKCFACWFTVSRGLLVRICQHRFPACMLVTSSRDWIW